MDSFYGIYNNKVYECEDHITFKEDEEAKEIVKTRLVLDENYRKPSKNLKQTGFLPKKLVKPITKEYIEKNLEEYRKKMKRLAEATYINIDLD